jgi:adenylate cyclase
MSLWGEIRRRNVHRVALAYVAAAWLLIQIAETLFPVFGLSDMAIRTVVIVLGIGFVPAVILSWVFEWTPEGFQRDGEITAPPPAARARRFDAAIIAMLVLAVAYFAVDKFVLDPARYAAMESAAEERGRTEGIVESFGDKSIAVLPFADLSPDGDQAYFSDGIAEELLNLLAKIRELRVISRSSSFQFRGNDIFIPDVANELNVTYVLEGSVRKAGNAIRITAQLIDARSDTHIWSETYDRELDDVFAIQDEISGEIVEELQVHLVGARPRADRTDPETHALYLQALHLFSEESNHELVEELLRQALQHDPDYVPALNLMVGAIYNITGDRDLDGSKYSFDEGISLMHRYVDRVLAIDPENGSATADRGWMAFFYNNDLETATSYINRALSYSPHDSNALFAGGMISARMGRNDDAIALIEAALLRDPLCSVCLYVLMKASINDGQFDKALEASERRMRVATGGWITRGNIYLYKGDAHKALELYDNQQENRVNWLSARVNALHELGDIDARDSALAELALTDDRWAYLGLAKAHAWMGNTDEAFDWLDRYIEPESAAFSRDLTAILWDPFFRNLWEDPRWLALREKANLGPERLVGLKIRAP